MSRKKALLASSLSLCSASWAISGQSLPVFAGEIVDTIQPKKDKELFAQEVLTNFLNPITAIAEGNLAAKIETKPITYRVAEGDTLSQIGLFYQVNYSQLAQLNNINNPDQLEVGYLLSIPLTRKWIRLNKGDTLETLAKKYRTTKELLLRLNPDVKETSPIFIGQLIAVPQKTTRPILKNVQTTVTQNPNLSDAPSNVRRLKPISDGAFASSWPVHGQITSNFGWRDGYQHKGIDIWSAAGSREHIHSALRGVVTRAGYSGAFGNLVVIDHGDGWETYYAHLSSIIVTKGQSVESGETIGNMGRTGDATGFHLHFEVHKNGSVINPLSVLR